jgi:hypothetical protein
MLLLLFLWSLSSLVLVASVLAWTGRIRGLRRRLSSLVLLVLVGSLLVPPFVNGEEARARVEALAHRRSVTQQTIWLPLKHRTDHQKSLLGFVLTSLIFFLG